VRRAKQRRRAWLLRLYRQGLLGVDGAGEQPAAQRERPGGGQAAAARPDERGQADDPAPRPVQGHAPGGGGPTGAAPAAGRAEDSLLEDLERRLRRLDTRQQRQSQEQQQQGPRPAAGEAGQSSSRSGAEPGGGSPVGGDDGDGGGAELLRWCRALDFEAYAASWREAACSCGSEVAAEALAAEGALLARLVAAPELATLG
jgi:hypothetical protein